jgi:hypothetical protein
MSEAQKDLTNGLSADPRLVVERVDPADTIPGENNTVGVLLVKAGTKTQYDDCQYVEELGRVVENRLGLGYAVSVAQSHYGDPTMDAVAAVMVEKRQASSLGCVLYLVFPGMVLRRNVLGGLGKLQHRYQDLSIIVAPPGVVDDRLVAADRVREARDRNGEW